MFPIVERNTVEHTHSRHRTRIGTAMKTRALLAVMLLACSGAAWAEEGLKDQTKPQVAAPDESFFNATWRRGVTQARMGELAARQAGSDAVRQLGDRLNVEHSRINEELKALARQKSVNIWGDPDNIKMSELRQLSGDAFDRAYLAEVVDNHERAIATFDDAVRTSSDPEIKAFAAKNLPALRSHLAGVKRLRTPDAVAPIKGSTGVIPN